MKKLTSLAKQFVKGEDGAEITELGLVLALIVAGCVAAIVALGPKIQKGWTDTNAAVP